MIGYEKYYYKTDKEGIITTPCKYLNGSCGVGSHMCECCNCSTGGSYKDQFIQCTYKYKKTKHNSIQQNRQNHQMLTN